MRDKRPEHLAEGETLSVSKMKDKRPFMVIAAPLVGIPVAGERASDDLAAQRTLQTKKVV